MPQRGRFNICDKNLPMLLELLNKDPDSYKDDFIEQYVHYCQTVKLLHLQPSQHAMDIEPLLELVNFLANACANYKSEAKDFASTIVDVLSRRNSGLDPQVRMAFCKALVTLRNRKIVNSLEVVQCFFTLVTCDDKVLRKFICGSIIALLKKMSKERTDLKLLSAIQAFLYTKLKESRSSIVRCSQLILIDAYRKGYLRNQKTANAIAECCFHKIARIQAIGMKFLLGSLDEVTAESDLSDSENDEKDEKTLKEVVCAFRAAKKTKKRMKKFEKAKKILGKEKKAKKDQNRKFCNLIAIQSIYDPQAFADRMFAMLEGKKNEKFEHRLLNMALTARFIGIHKLQTLGFYSYLHRYLLPRQREVTRILLYAAQACHELVPPDIVHQLVHVIAQNFVTDRNSPEAITVGINAIREIFVNAPFAANEDLLRDLTEYKSYKNKNVSMAARAIITLFRNVNPKLLNRKDRGRPTEAMKDIEMLDFGKGSIKSHVPGAECLPLELEEASNHGDVNINISDDESDSLTDVEFDDEIESEESIDETVVSSEHLSTSVDPAEDGQLETLEKSETDAAGLKEKAQMICENRILTQEEFKRINLFKLKKHVSKGKRKIDDIVLEEDLEKKIARRDDDSALPRLRDIEKFHKKMRRQTKEQRMEQVMEGREGRDQYGKPKKGSHVGRTNRELAKCKNFQMVRHKIRGKNRQRSFRDRQESLRKYLLRQAGRKV